MKRAIRRLLVAVGFSSGLIAVTASAARRSCRSITASRSCAKAAEKAVSAAVRAAGAPGPAPGAPSAGPPLPAAAVGASPRPLLTDIYQCASTQGNDSYRVPVAIAWGEPP
jgi:hypothetical protein